MVVIFLVQSLAAPTKQHAILHFSEDLSSRTFKPMCSRVMILKIAMYECYLGTHGVTFCDTVYQACRKAFGKNSD